MPHDERSTPGKHPLGLPTSSTNFKPEAKPTHADDRTTLRSIGLQSASPAGELWGIAVVRESLRGVVAARGRTPASDFRSGFEALPQGDRERATPRHARADQSCGRG